MMNACEKKQLQINACKVRMGAVEGVYCAKSGHPGGSLSAADIFTYLYFKEMHIDPKDPKNPDRDRFVLSKGHCAPGLYAALALRGYFSMDELKTLRHIGAMLQGHPDMKGTPGIDMSSGSLGQGISAACGMAKAAKMDGKDYRVYTLLGDGECEEGQVWEAAMFAGHQKLDNLCVIVDFNGLQIDGPISEVAGPEPFDKKFEAFGFDVQYALIGRHKLFAVERIAETFGCLGNLFFDFFVLFGNPVLNQYVGTIPLLAVLVVDKGVVEGTHVARCLPGLRVHEDGRVNPHDIVVEFGHRIPPVAFDVVLQFNTQLTVVVNGSQTVVYLARRENKPVLFAVGNEFFEKFFLCHRS